MSSALILDKRELRHYARFIFGRRELDITALFVHCAKSHFTIPTLVHSYRLPCSRSAYQKSTHDTLTHALQATLSFDSSCDSQLSAK
jgi:hypothetical protein